MKLQIDTTNKTIKVEGTVPMLELIETLKRLLPNGVWKTFSIESGTTIIWSNPVTIYPSWPYYPWWYQPSIIYRGIPGTPVTGDTYTLTNDSGAQVTYNLVPGTYNIET